MEKPEGEFCLELTAARTRVWEVLRPYRMKLLRLAPAKFIHFGTTREMLINTERRQTVHYRADRMAFRVLLCMDGCGTISYDEGTVNFYKGDCVFVPADSEVLTIHGQAQFLDIRG